MGRNRFFALLTALCLLISMAPPHSHASQLEELETVVHGRRHWEATRDIRTGPQGNHYVSDKTQAVLPAGEEEYLVSGVLDDVCQWGIAEDGYLYIWCDGDMPSRASAEDYPWYPYMDMFGGLFVASGSVADYAFANYDNLYYVYLETTVTSIGARAFTSCNLLEEFWFYGAAPTIASDAFSGVEAVMVYHEGDTSFEGVAGKNYGGNLQWVTWVEAIDGGMFDTVEWYVYEDMSLRLYGTGNPMQSLSSAGAYPWHSYIGDITAISIEQVSYVGDHAFMGCHNVTELITDEGIYGIGAYAFAGIQAETLPLYTVSVVGEGAFTGAAVKELTFSQQLLELGSSAFADCAALTQITFEGSPPAIGENAFKNVTAAVSYPLSNELWEPAAGQNYGGDLTWEGQFIQIDTGLLGTVQWTLADTGDLFLEGDGSAMADLGDPAQYPWTQYASMIRRVHVTGVSHLGSYCFDGCTALEEVTFDSQLRSIGDGAFRGCTAPFAITFSGSAPTLGIQVFSTTDLTLNYPQEDPTWTEAVIAQFLGGSGGENELPPVEIPPEENPVGCGMYEADVYQAMIALEPQYPEGMRWTNDDYYAWNGGIFPGGYGCAGFAFILSDAAFGSLPARIIEENITIGDIRVGDILRINNDTHSVIVLEVHDDHVVIAEGNYNSSIHWGRTLSAATVASTTDYIMTRYPEHSWSSDSCLEARTCAKCGLQEEAPGHKWLDASCTAPKTCRVCGAAEGTPAGHSWIEATCAKAQTCMICGLTQGTATGLHIYTDDADTSCNVCGSLRDTGDQPPVTAQMPLTDFELEVLRLANLERIAAGLNPLTATETLQQATDIRAEELKASFSHTRPNGTSCFSVLAELGIGYSAAAENIAMGYRNPASVMEGWMNSPGHRENILTSYLGHMGVGESDLHWVQLFTNAPAYTSIRVDVPEGTTVKPGTAIDDMGLVAVLQNANGSCWLPLAGAYCSGYDASLPGAQTVTVSVLGVICTFTVTVETHQHTWVEATCETPRTCSECGKAEGAPLGHNWLNAACEAPKTCTACGKTEGEALGHNWKAATCEAPKTCDTCGKTEGSALGHSWTDATCEAPKACSVCGKTEGSPLGHDWDTATCEEPRACSRCGTVTDPALGHSWTDATCYDPKTCSVCGLTEGEALGHSWKAATCEEPKTCAACGWTEDAPLGHNWQAATCEAPQTCLTCGKTGGEALGHSWQNATCEVPKTCAVCGKTEGEALGHSWTDATCDAPKTCSACGNIEGAPLGHRWTDATCEAPQTCSTCGKTVGEALGHDWKNATCEAPRTCAVCGKTEGTPIAHSWDSGTVTTEPTPETEGQRTYTCLSCGTTRTEPIPATLSPFVKVDQPDTAAPKFGFSYDIPEDGATVLIFFSSQCGLSQSLMQMLNMSDWLANPWVEVIAVESYAGTAEATEAFRDTYTPDIQQYIRYLYTTDTSICFDYYRMFSSESSLTWPLVMVITGSSEAPVVRFAAEGMTNPNALWQVLAHVSPAFAGWDGTVHEHVWVEATCEAPRTCSECGQTQGEPLGHSWTDATCQAPKTCSVCAKTEGTALDHSFQNGECMLCGTAEVIRGDANGDGVVNYQDALMVLRCSIGLAVLDDTVRDACDVDSSGKLDYQDALTILRFSINLIPELPPKA